MASLLFDDYDFPRELWDSSTQTFTTPVDTLLTFCPHIVTQLKKEPREQEPIKQEKGTFEKFFETSKNNLASTFSISMAERTFRFCVEAATAYLETTNDRSARRRRYSELYRQDIFSDEEDEAMSMRRWRRRQDTEPRGRDNRKREEKIEEEEEKKKQEVAIIKKENMSLMTKSVASLAALTISLYSAHRASISWGDITFHGQLELLTTHVNAALESTSAWIKDRQDMNDEIPDIIVRDVNRLRELISLIERLDSRTEKRLETAGWGISTAGSLSVLGGIALGWTDQALILSGAAMVGGILFGIVNRTRWNGASWKASKAVLEARLSTLVRDINRDAPLREHTIQELEQKVRKPGVYDASTTTLPGLSNSHPTNVKAELQADETVGTSRSKQPVPSSS
ncbi:hypothetical protein K450DRAFT_217034 [Umbelopsis ramanniana AG]|uniref:Uncharacterized protein n=1 Tax=Umbelopsis ramanniana AG TaxID=1314678 RepID=A0AAD5HHJ2_UMBRA|nr:uncharacterized protein K450DRAFT_217034 [Umbelopsis ramanniana AG]KAI8584595.1 hypothetical protein K450DRAFT_217034 [Umbelopsis ramanniana AG]